MPKRRRIDVAVTAAGALTPLAFAPFGFWPLLPPVLALLIYSWLYVDAKRAAFRGFLYGVGAFGVGTSWVYVSLNKFGGMAPPLAVVAVFLFVLILAAFVALIGYVLRRLHGPGWTFRLVYLAPAAWVLGEWLRSLWILSFPWLSVGYSLADTPAAGLAAVTSIYGLSFLLVLSAALALGLILGKGRARILSAGLIAVVVVVALSVARIDWVEPDGETLSVGLVQANVPIEHKWLPDKRELIREQYLDMSESLREADLIVWPEAALPRFVDELDAGFWRSLGAYPATFIFGVLERRQQDSVLVLHNSAVIATNDTRPRFYRKRHLVAFGEYVPFGALLRPLVEYMAIPMADFRPWHEDQGSFDAAGTQLGVSICYEDAFPEDIRRSLPDAGVLVNLSEDAWFGNSLGPHQRLDMARIRAIESGRPMVRASNTGVSGLIDHRGRLVEEIEQFKRQTLLVEVQPQRGITPFVHFGIWPVLALSLTLLIFGIWQAQRRR